jgi:hypothetical protein
MRAHTEAGSETVEQRFGIRNCYQIAHEKRFDEYWAFGSQAKSHFALVSCDLLNVDDNESSEENVRLNTL